MATSETALKQVILLVLVVELKDDLGELGDLLAHLVVGLLGGACSRHFKYETSF